MAVLLRVRVLVEELPRVGRFTLVRVLGMLRVQYEADGHPQRNGGICIACGQPAAREPKSGRGGSFCGRNRCNKAWMRARREFRRTAGVAVIVLRDSTDGDLLLHAELSRAFPLSVVRHLEERERARDREAAYVSHRSNLLGG